MSNARRWRRPGLGTVAAARIACVAILVTACGSSTSSAAPVTLRLEVSMTPEELASFNPAIKAIDAAHPEWIIQVEPVPQDGEVEKITNELAGDNLPDIVRVTGSNAQQWIRRKAFTDLTPLATGAGLDLADFYAGTLDQFRWQGELWGIPDTASPEIVFYNKAMFDAAGLSYPTESWTYDDMRAAAKKLTLDTAGHDATDAAFDPSKVRQWGWNGGLTYFWQNEEVKALGGNLCANADCTQMDFTSPATSKAIGWWVGLVRDDHAGLYDPYGSSQKGVDGDPFIAGVAAMGSNGSFAIGQLDAEAKVKYDVLPPFLGVDGARHTPLSTNGYVIGAQSRHQAEAWKLIQLLVAPDFLATTWGRPGHAVPARRSAASSVIDLSHAPANQAAILTAMGVGEIFRPYTSSAFATYQATLDLFMKMNTGAVSLADGEAALEKAANDTLAPDRSP
ncbi:MAG: sugar ABC transporter substrate-binding protein [Chloroflexi bacterium]|nr:sugar ABC transporter substrate-binding protein [Chloroflexota bacterium]